MAFRLTIFLRCGNNDFTEVWWNNSFTNFGLMLQDLNLMIPQRVNLGGKQLNCQGVRVSDDPADRLAETYFPSSSYVRDGLGIVTGKWASASLLDAEFTGASVLCRAFGPQKKKRNFFLAGVPDILFGPPGTGMAFNQDPTWLPSFTAWIAYLQGHGYCWKSRNADTTPPSNPIVGLVRGVANNGQVGIQTAAAIGGGAGAVSVGTKLKIYGATRTNAAYQSLNGIWTVTTIVPPAAPSTVFTYYLGGTTGINPANILSPGFVFPFTYTYTGVVTGNPIGPTTHKRKNALPRQAGRRKVRRPLLA